MAHLLHNGDLLLHQRELGLPRPQILFTEQFSVDDLHCKNLFAYNVEDFLYLGELALPQLLHDHVVVDLLLAVCLA